MFNPFLNRFLNFWSSILWAKLIDDAIDFVIGNQPSLRPQ
jgi:hypothetical protein